MLSANKCFGVPRDWLAELMRPAAFWEIHLSGAVPELLEEYHILQKKKKKQSSSFIKRLNKLYFVSHLEKNNSSGFMKCELLQRETFEYVLHCLAKWHQSDLVTYPWVLAVAELPPVGITSVLDGTGLLCCLGHCFLEEVWTHPGMVLTPLHVGAFVRLFSEH